MTATILLTGFELFKEFAVNSSWEGVRLLAERHPGLVSALCLPVDHEAAARRLTERLEALRPEACLCTGLASDATGPELRIERRARKPAELADRDGPPVLVGAWDWVGLEAALRATSYPVSMSGDAGGYVCESTYWRLLAFRAQRGFPERAAFLHVAPLSEGFTAADVATAFEAALNLESPPSSDRSGR